VPFGCGHSPYKKALGITRKKDSILRRACLKTVEKIALYIFRFSALFFMQLRAMRKPKIPVKMTIFSINNYSTDNSESVALPCS